MSSLHVPVLLAEVLSFIETIDAKTVLDGTFGGGGHSRAILEKLPRVKVIALDADQSAVNRGEVLKKEFGDRISLHRGNFRNFREFLRLEGVDRVDASLVDLGLSSDLIADSERGFSFMADGPLDMRMDTRLDLTAEDIVNRFPKEELEKIFSEYGEETRARKIAEAIVHERRRRRITTTAELSGIVRSVVRSGGKTNPATRVFQALRIAVNDELGALSEYMEAMTGCLSCSGRMLIISFHSLEDRMVKNFFREKEKEGMLKIVSKKPVTAVRSEVLRNRRSRSAKLRVAERICGETAA